MTAGQPACDVEMPDLVLEAGEEPRSRLGAVALVAPCGGQLDDPSLTSKPAGIGGLAFKQFAAGLDESERTSALGEKADVVHVSRYDC